MERASRKERGFWSEHGAVAGQLVPLFFKPKAAKRILSDPLEWDASLADKLWGEDKSPNVEIIGELIAGLSDENVLAVQRAAELLLRIRRSEQDGR